MKKNLAKRIMALCMAALVVVMSTTGTADAVNSIITPCSDIEPDINMND